jgi:hypothetical protein
LATSAIKDIRMVSAVSNSSSTLISAASSNSDVSALQAQLAEKQAALAKTEDRDEKATIEKAIAALEAKIEKALVSAQGSSTKSAPAVQAQMQEAPAKASGESERIGSTNFDEATEFGDRTAYI